MYRRKQPIQKMALRLIFFTVILLKSMVQVPLNSLYNIPTTLPRKIGVKYSSIPRHHKNKTIHSITMTKSVKPQRIAIVAKDIVQLYGCSESTARRKLQLVRDTLAKTEKQTITIKDFCTVYGLDYVETLQYLDLV